MKKITVSQSSINPVIDFHFMKRLFIIVAVVVAIQYQSCHRFPLRAFVEKCKAKGMVAIQYQSCHRFPRQDLVRVLAGIKKSQSSINPVIDFHKFIYFLGRNSKPGRNPVSILSSISTTILMLAGGMTAGSQSSINPVIDFHAEGQQYQVDTSVQSQSSINPVIDFHSVIATMAVPTGA